METKGTTNKSKGDSKEDYDSSEPMAVENGSSVLKLGKKYEEDKIIIMLYYL